MSDPLQEMNREIGRQGGVQEEMRIRQAEHTTTLERIEKRLDDIEVRATTVGGTAGGIFALGVALIKETLGKS